MVCRVAISWDRAEELKERHCYVAEDYVHELKKFQVRAADPDRQLPELRCGFSAVDGNSGSLVHH